MAPTSKYIECFSDIVGDDRGVRLPAGAGENRRFVPLSDGLRRAAERAARRISDEADPNLVSFSLSTGQRRIKDAIADDLDLPRRFANAGAVSHGYALRCLSKGVRPLEVARRLALSVDTVGLIYVPEAEKIRKHGAS